MLNICSVLKHKAKIVKQWLYIYVFCLFAGKKRYCSSYSRSLYTQRPTNLAPLMKFYFRQKSYGWNPCRVYSIFATVYNTSKHV